MSSFHFLMRGLKRKTIRINAIKVHIENHEKAIIRLFINDNYNYNYKQINICVRVPRRQEVDNIYAVLVY